MAAPDSTRNAAAPDAGTPGAAAQDEEIKVVKLSPGDIPLAVGSKDEKAAGDDDPFNVEMDEESEEPDEEPAAPVAATKPAEKAAGAAEKPKEEAKAGIGEFLDDIFAEGEEADNGLSAFTDLEPLSMNEVASELEAVLEELKLRQQGT